jgi:hypothetical protein
MRAIGLGSITLATVVLTATDVRGANNNWCATYTKPENENCTFATFEQCRATVWGVGGWCRPNPFPNTAFGTGWSWSKPPRGVWAASSCLDDRAASLSRAAPANLGGDAGTRPHDNF